MNKGNLFGAVLMGVFIGMQVFSAIDPQPEALNFHPNLKGEYVDPIEEDEYRAEIKIGDGGPITVYFEPRRQFGHYLTIIGVSILAAGVLYRNAQDQLKRQREKKVEDDGHSPSINYTPDRERLYKEFLKGDPKLRNLPRVELEDEFQAWQENRSQPDGEEVI